MVIRSRGDPESPDDLAGGEASRPSTTRSARWAWLRRQRGIVAADLRLRSLRVIEEIEVVDRDRPGPRARPASSADAAHARRRPVRHSHSTGGHSSRCQAKLRSRTGTRASTTVRPGRRHGGRRSFQELEKSVSVSDAASRRVESRRELVDVFADARALREAPADSPAECAIARPS